MQNDFRKDSIINSPIGTVLRVSTVPFFVRTQLKKQINDLLKSGINVVIICSPGLKISEFNHYGRLRIVDINICRNINIVSDIYALLQLLRFLFSERISIIHSTTPKAGLLASIAGVIAGVPCRLHTFTGQPWSVGNGFATFFSKMSDKVIGSLSNFTFADSKGQRSFLIDKKIINPSKITVLGDGSLSGIDLERFNDSNYSESTKRRVREALKIPSNAFLFLFLGRITPSKGVREILSAFLILTKHHHLAHFLFVGPIEEGYLEEFNSQTASIGNIHIVGYTDIPEQYISIAHVLCLPSYREGFGTSVIEAAAMGIPAIGTRIYGLEDSIIDGVTGILVPPQDECALLEALKYMIKNPSKRLAFSEAAKKRAIELYDSNKVSERLIFEYERWSDSGQF
jgi:glycosyltransferase involved in cell wall biosynthesis